MKRRAIVNGDDLGLSPGINKGIVEAYRDGILTSASLMATGEAFDEAVTLVREHPGLSVGIHLTLVEGIPALSPQKIPSLVGSDGRFHGSLGAFAMKWLTGRIRLEEVQLEFQAQIERVLDYGINIEKLDSHMHLHLLPRIIQTVLAMAKRYGIKDVRLPKGRFVDVGLRRSLIPLLSASHSRRVAIAGLASSDRFAGITESGRLTERSLMRILEGLQQGVTEVMVHPGYRDAVLDKWPKSRLYDREGELNALISPRIKALIEELGIALINYREVCRHV
ncbi:MAG: ChbG/HpnK family deacetylase [candidate division NC10 bacterium]|nr:ChbG/HpnK family deacetylase [candidate division NC10 bacterium]